jgi:hypothetical protein
VGCWVKGCEVPCKVKTATTFVKSTTMIDKTKAMIDKSKAVMLAFRVERTVYGKSKDVTNVKFIE